MVDYDAFLAAHMAQPHGIMRYDLESETLWVKRANAGNPGWHYRLLDVLAGYTVEDPKTVAGIGHIPAGGYTSKLSATALTLLLLPMLFRRFGLPRARAAGEETSA